MPAQQTVGPGHNQPPPPFFIRPQPDLDRTPALIFPRRRLVTSPGRSREGEWVLRFERRRAPFLDPLTGWTGGDDPLAQVELSFASRMEAIGYAEHQGLAWRVVDEPSSAQAPARQQPGAPRSNDDHDAIDTAMGAVVSLSWLRETYGSCHLSGLPELDRALVNPAAVFSSPDEVVRHPLLTIDCKREILWRWAWDEYLLDLALAEGMPESEPSRLPEVRTALRLLNTEWSPDPAAPAAFVVRFEQNGLPMAA